MCTPRQFVGKKIHIVLRALRKSTVKNYEKSRYVYYVRGRFFPPKLLLYVVLLDNALSLRFVCKRTRSMSQIQQSNDVVGDNSTAQKVPSRETAVRRKSTNAKRSFPFMCGTSQLMCCGTWGAHHTLYGFSCACAFLACAACLVKGFNKSSCN